MLDFLSRLFSVPFQFTSTTLSEESIPSILPDEVQKRDYCVQEIGSISSNDLGNAHFDRIKDAHFIFDESGTTCYMTWGKSLMLFTKLQRQETFDRKIHSWRGFYHDNPVRIDLNYLTGELYIVTVQEGKIAFAMVLITQGDNNEQLEKG